MRIAHRGGAQDQAVDALLEPRDDSVEVADPAAELDRDMHSCENRLDRRRIDRLTGEGAVEMDDVQGLENLVPEVAARGGGRGGEYRRLGHFPLSERAESATL